MYWCWPPAPRGASAHPSSWCAIDGEALLQRAVGRATEVAGHAVTVVLGAHAAELTPLVRHSSASVVINRHWEEGLASSLRLGVSQLPGSTEAVLVTLADQAAITTFDLRRLVAGWQRQPDGVIAASYDGHTGVPAVFPRHAFACCWRCAAMSAPALRCPSWPTACLRVPMPNAGIDIDTPEDLLKLQSGAGKPG